MSRLAITVDIGGTRTRAALIDDSGHILTRASIATNPQQGVNAGLERMAAAIHQVMGETPQQDIAGIGLGSAGLIDSQRGILYTPANLPGWNDVPLRDYFEQAFGLPVGIGNDANLAALGEHRFGAGRGASDMVYMTISTGIGGGVISGGKLFGGAGGYAGEVGHHTIDVNGPRCNCGNIGCLETLAAGPAIARAARAAIAAGESTIILRLAGGDADAITAATIAKAAAEQDALALRVIAQAGEYIGVGVINLIHLFDTEMIVLGGGVSNIGEPLFGAIRRTVRERSFAVKRKDVPIVSAALGDDVGLLGAAALVFG